MEKIIDTFKNIWKIEELRNRVMFTFGILALYRLGCQVLVPGINGAAVTDFVSGGDNDLLNMVNTFTGGALGQGAVFALGIMPYITASIILQILQKTVPSLERLAKEGEAGRNKINRYTRYLTVALALLHSYGVTTLLISMGSENFLTIDNILLFRVIAMITLTTGAIVIMWLGEKITEKGIGNGISLIIFASIVVTIPGALMELYTSIVNSTISAPVVLLLLAVVIGTILFVVFFELGVRRITIQYAKRATAGGQMAGGTSHLPFKVNAAGVIPVIFSASFIQLPGLANQMRVTTLNQEDPNALVEFFFNFMAHLDYGRPLNNLLFFVLTMFFTFFYVDMLFNPKDTAENLKKHGGFIPGIRPGKETQVYIENVLARLTLWGGLYLCFVSLIPTFLMSGLQLNTLPDWLGGQFFENILPTMVNSGTGLTLFMALGGTSLLILISVALDFVNQVENQLVMRKYDGFTTKSRTGGGQQARTRRYA